MNRSPETRCAVLVCILFDGMWHFMRCTTYIPNIIYYGMLIISEAANTGFFNKAVGWSKN